jgi:hypothetical protein
VIRFVKYLFGSNKARAARGRKRTTVRLGIECLEGRLVPTFNVVGNTLGVVGTGGPDSFTFTAGPTPQVTLNDDTFIVDPNQINAIAFDGSGGNVDATITDTTGNAVNGLIYAGGGWLSGSNYTLSLTNVNYVNVHGSANTTLEVSGSTVSRNFFSGSPTYSNLYGDNYNINVWGVGTVYADAVTTRDTAQLVGSRSETNAFVANNTFDPSDGGYAFMASDSAISGDGSRDYFVEAKGFANVSAYAGTSADEAILYAPNQGTNTFVGWPSTASLKGMLYADTANGFGRVYAYGGSYETTPQSANVAELHGSTTVANNDVGTQGDSILSAYDSSYRLEAISFESVSAYGGTSGDHADLYGSTTDANIFKGAPTAATMSATGYYNAIYNVPYVTAHNGTASDTAEFWGANNNADPNTFLGYPTAAVMYNSTYSLTALNFRRVYAWAGTTGDRATLYYGFGDSLQWGGSTYCYTIGANYFNEVFGFGWIDFRAL